MCALVSTISLAACANRSQPHHSLHRVFPRSVRRKKNRSSRESRRRRWIQRRRRRKAAPKAARPQKAARQPGNAGGNRWFCIRHGGQRHHSGNDPARRPADPSRYQNAGNHRRPYLRMVFIFHRSGSRSHLQYYPHQRFPGRKRNQHAI